MLSPTIPNFADGGRTERLIPGPEPKLSPCLSGPREGKTYPVAETRLVGNERRYLNECIDSNWISSQGPFVAKFERAFARQTGCAFGVSCSSGTAALHLALAALDIGPGDEVIVPAFTMIAPANAVNYTGATLRLVDVEPATFNIDVSAVESAITPRTKAIIVVHTYGHPANITALKSIAERRGIHLIEDAAEAHGAELAGQRVGSFGVVGTFSFYANKVITTGEGGMVTTNNEDLAILMARLRDHSFHPKRHFWHEYQGFNYRMTNLQAAIGFAQTQRFDEAVAARRKLRRWYDDRLRALQAIELPTEMSGSKSVFWMYNIRLSDSSPCQSYDLRTELAARGIESRSFFVPLHLQPILFERFRDQRFPVSERLCASGLYLPTHENLQEDDVDWICAQITGILSRHQGEQQASQLVQTTKGVTAE